MSEISLITGGCRSGKSAKALELADVEGANKTFLATCIPYDEEMKDRVRRHKIERQDQGWATIEEPIELQKVIQRLDSDVILVDCLTLWTSNLMFHHEQAGQAFEEAHMAQWTQGLIDACKSSSAHIIFVGNEVGMGIVPENALARSFRDLNGRCQQMIAQASDRAILMVSGLPLVLK
jgi:adenosylcobinamide kinase/adenosylcobinamide-phosphate guanylyltransferase